ncbi:MAG: ATP-dependent protease ATPase subunit HslU [Myxococcota bacterium]|nr:ATP-dependent protease ATPase subunit HslU [Myxococcota bacterium]
MTAYRPTFTPRETVSELDRYIVGQNKAKKAVAIALRNRWRRRQVSDDLRDEINPKNIIMIGPTGVGKTEIARRLAKLGQAPFIKVEASKFTEVGYVGRDVESMIRDLTDIAINMVKVEETERNETKAAAAAEDRLIELLLEEARPHMQNATPQNYFSVGPDGSTVNVSPAERESLRQQLRSGSLDEAMVTIKTAVNQPGPQFEILAGAGMDDMMSNLKDALGNLQGMMPGGGKSREQRVNVPEALRILTEQESEKLVDMDRVTELALDRVQNSGIIFVDEIDKIAMGGNRGGTGGPGPDISRGGVQRDLLPIVEGSMVTTKYGVVRTDHILFIAAGAFHEAKVSDLIPELQGRFPIRVELNALGEDEFFRILTEPRNSLVRQYEALMATEGVTLVFEDDGIRELARVAFEANTRLENIGARRLHTVLENLLEDVSFKAPELTGKTITIDANLVRDKMGEVLEDDDLRRYIL